MPPFGSSGVIQGSFPHGAPRVAAPVQRLAAGTAVRLPAPLPPPAMPGRPLPPVVQRKMEALFGTSFADVRIHVGPQAAAIGANAFTRGNDIFFAPGQYAPETARGQNILAYELTHVVQQKNGRARNPFGSGTVVIHDAGLEAEAQRMSLRAATTRTIQRYCGTPGCSDPNCHDPKNHGFDRVFNLRGRTLYYGEIDKDDIGTGTDTSKKTRDYVKSSNTYYPEQVSITYHSNNITGHSTHINEPLQPGQNPDAGHIFGNQFGGFGNDTGSVFPQNPQINRGNYLDDEPTHSRWRKHEDNIRQSAMKDLTRVNVTIRKHERTKYGKKQLTKQEQDYLEKWLQEAKKRPFK